MENSLTIGQVANQSKVGIETIRFYERQGLLPNPPRTPSGYRLYTPITIQRLLFIQQAKALGFTLKEIYDLLSLRVQKGGSCASVKKKILLKIASIEEKIVDLQHIGKSLKKLARQCDGKAPLSECPILENLGRKRRKKL